MAQTLLRGVVASYYLVINTMMLIKRCHNFAQQSLHL